MPEGFALRHSKLYLRASPHVDFSEKHAITSVAAATDGRLQTRFTTEACPPPFSIRFDPETVPGLYRIYEIEWRCYDSGELLATLNGSKLRDQLLRVNGVLLPASDDMIELWANDDDPQFEIRWPDQVPGPKAVAIVMSWGFEQIDPVENAELVERLLALPDHSALVQGIALTDNRAKINFALEREKLIAELSGLIAERVDLLSRDFQHLFERHEHAWRDRLNALDERHVGLIGHLRDSLQRAEQRSSDLHVAARGLQNRVEALQASVELHFAVLRQHVTNAGTWVRLRRGISSRLDLIRRYRFMPGEIGDLIALDGGKWKVAGRDPRIILVTKKFVRPSAGWYLVDVALGCELPGMLVDPCLYVDYGDGMGEKGKIPLELSNDTLQQRLYLKFTGDVHAIRIDPTTGAGIFFFRELHARKMTRMEVAVRLAWPILRRVARSPRSLFAAANQFLGTLRREGLAGVERRLRELRNDQGRKQDYSAWTRHFDTLNDVDRNAVRGAISVMTRQPLFSIIMPTFNSPERWLRRCLDSVLAQLYPHWELCIADDASTESSVRAVLDEYVARDPRIRVVLRELNGHISAASNSALELARGDYLVLLDHDDELPEHALFMVAERLGRDPHLKVIYSDEDKIDDEGRRYDPYFKPDWNPDLFLGQNLISHLGVYDAALVREVGGFREGYEGSQDYDLALRCIERIPLSMIGHIPHVLYHWRALPGSTALATSEKDYAKSAAERALSSHFERISIRAEISSIAGGYHRVRYPLDMALAPLVSLIVPTRDRVDLLRVCVGSILERTSYPNFEIVIVDNQSCETKTLAYLDDIQSDPRVRVITYDRPFNFSAINNFAVKHARGPIIGLINNDIETIHADWLEEMVSHALRSDVGAVGAMLYYPDNRIQHAGVVIGYQGVAGHAYQGEPRGTHGQLGRARLVQELSCVTAACLLMRADIFTAVGGLDEGLQVAFNDVDFCLRIRQAGYRIIWTPFAELYHHESASRGYEDSPEKLARFHSEIAFMQERWGDTLLSDPAYNPNLALDGEPFALAWPPRVSYPFRSVRDP